MKIIIIALLLTHHVVVAAEDFKLIKNVLSYEFEFMMKTVKGVSKKARGKGQCMNDTCKFMIAVPVKTFDSGNSNRDLNMLKATNAGKHPMVALVAEFNKPPLKGKIRINAKLKFAGVESNRTIFCDIENKDNTLIFGGNFKILLSDFNIERPSLLGMKIPDKIKITFKTEWK